MRKEFYRVILKEEFWVNILGFEAGFYIRYELFGGKIIWYDSNNGREIPEYNNRYFEEVYQNDPYTKAEQRNKRIDQILTD
jgi:hypothetical protein